MYCYITETNSDLQHHGILGQKWGIRRFRNQDGTLTPAGKKRYSSIESIKTKNDEDLFLAKKKNRIRSNEINYTIYTQGKKVGDMYLEDHGEELYGNWIDIKKAYRGRGYANAVMDYVIEYGQKNGFKYMTLEVPESSPDAKHIYEKHGFKETEKLTNDDVWGGLTSMRRKL